MPGLIGIINSGEKINSIRHAISSICNVPYCKGREFKINDSIFANVFLKDNKISHYYNAETKISIAYTGTIFTTKPNLHAVDLRELFDAYVKKGINYFYHLEGTFNIMVVDQHKNKLFLINDRLGTLPCLYYYNQKTFCFAPESKVLFKLLPHLVPKFSMTGLISFLTAGYQLNDQTIFDDIKYLEGATLLTLDLKDFSLTKKRYWDLKFDPQNNLNKNSASRLLYDAVAESHKLLLSDNPKHFDILLSGGLDSRGIVGVLDNIGKLPRKAFTWGISDNIPRSDSYIAKQLAQSFNIDFKYYYYDTDRFVNNATDWVYISELMNDNLGWYGEGPCVYKEFYEENSNFLFIGDEIWGWGMIPVNKDQAISEVLPNEILPAMKSVMKDKYITEVNKLYTSQIQKVIDRFQGCNLNDLKDYIYVNIREQRFIFSLGYFKEHAVEIRRPFLTSPVIDVITKIPRKLRLDKVAFVTMLKNFTPKVMNFPWASTNSLPDWRHDLIAKENLKNYLRSLLDYDRISAGPLADLIDKENFIRERDLFLNSKPTPANRKFSRIKYIKTNLKRSLLSKNYLFAKLTSSFKNNNFNKDSNFEFFRRIALFNLLQENLSRFR